MRFLGLDVSKSCTGWGLYSPDEVDAGTLKCPIKPPFGLQRGKIDASYAGRVADWYAQEMDALIVKLRPDMVGIEQPLPGNSTREVLVADKTQGSLADDRMQFQKMKKAKVGGTSFDVTHFLHGLAIGAARIASRRSIPPLYVPSQTWRSSTGVGRAPKGSGSSATSWYKRKAKEICSHLGHPQKSGDAAEGLLIAYHLYLLNSPIDLFGQKKAGLHE
ncbi:hypothetical protein GCM10007094_23480 [Pseudovibrio japonicus]|uniref:Uncharacterized protein n=1 Tax=Pseudovibrio japonicus TaxID=366534 RepID=A0ABQ3EGI0_9HYPH|nr:hypothetical protein [Pseudovibrio japonicus]GHB33874.1 hypothetical protein GCM10007094_23480 [Pseudovibrio japonicus]